MRPSQKSTKTSENFFDNWKRMIQYSQRYWKGLLLAILFAAGGNILTVLGPDRLADMTDTISAGLKTSIDMTAIRNIAFSILFLYGFGGLLNLLQGWIMVNITQNITRSLRADIANKINRLPMAYFSNTTVGDTLSRVTNDVDTIGRALNMSVQNLISSGTMMLGTLIMMLLTNVWLTLTAIGATAIGLISIGIITRFSQKYFVQQQNHLGAINGQIEETFSGHTVVKVYNGEEMVRKEFTDMNNQLKESGFKSQALSSLMSPIMTFIGNFGYVAVAVLGALLTMNGTVSFGVVVAFIMYVRLFTQPLSQIAQSVQSLQSAAAAGERVFSMLDAEEMADESAKTEEIIDTKGYVEFSNVQFSYGKDEPPVIKDFSAVANPGQKIAIVGHTGAGKTTIVNLLMRFYEINRGEISIDGLSTQEITKENLHDQFCMVLQDTWVFEGTVRENLIYNAQNISDKEMIEASKAVGLDFFVRTLSKGYDTLLDEKVSLSQGQKQQLTIARAIIANRPMLILDEATSSVDTRTELKIQEAMDALMEGRTTFVIAHRLSTIKNADTILVMDNGDIIEKGSHEDLMAQNGFYKDLYNSQFDNVS
ncbi:ATP-binding cassette, subfamily B [Atopostipes suicloacalis DSM 15692]|uniref:ATP-binding cassette, subfamily B n=1 Tax=Atopostipes suicloacalis DSM 15692 TaxID=1121025 RepID=A0A1M4ZEL8_9LACT|nr:ABC transporter ATP-binding protein [Atopostipes suicloacalis]SHF16046.1 ATP-binding cassette, subfamily B [Atopostipes suicloacalis DSM 15692]